LLPSVFQLPATTRGHEAAELLTAGLSSALSLSVAA
jgi:hypothetical protein